MDHRSHLFPSALDTCSGEIIRMHVRECRRWRNGIDSGEMFYECLPQKITGFDLLSLSSFVRIGRARRSCRLNGCRGGHRVALICRCRRPSAPTLAGRATKWSTLLLRLRAHHVDSVFGCSGEQQNKRNYEMINLVDKNGRNGRERGERVRSGRSPFTRRIHAMNGKWQLDHAISPLCFKLLFLFFIFPCFARLSRPLRCSQNDCARGDK